MAASTSKSLKDYLKRYDSSYVEESEKKKKKKKANITEPKQTLGGVLIVDQDPVWQKSVNINEEEDDNNSPDEDKPLIDEDIEVKRLRRLEMIKARRAYNAMSEDGSGWVSINGDSANVNQTSDLSPLHERSVRNDTPSPDPVRDLASDLSPPRKRPIQNDTPSPDRVRNLASDLSLPHKNRARKDTPSPGRGGKDFGSGGDEAGDLSPPRKRAELGVKGEVSDLSPARRSAKRHYSVSSEAGVGSDLSPPRKKGKARNDTPSPHRERKVSKADEGISLSSRGAGVTSDLPPPRRRGRARNDTPSLQRERKVSRKEEDISPPRRGQRGRRHDSPLVTDRGDSDMSPPRRPHVGSDLSPTRRKVREVGRAGTDDLSPPRLRQDNAPPTRSRWEPKETNAKKEHPKTGLITGREMQEEISKKRKEDISRFGQMDPSISGRGAEPVYRDKTGARISKEEYLKSKQKVEEKPKEVKIEWGKGLAQKREHESKLKEIEVEKDKPFARTRDDPELDKMLKDRLRWGDPMAHLVKKKHYEPILPDLGDNEKMKESGFIIPQDVPNHSWIKRGLDAAPNRYGIKPGRHWDGVDRSNGYEKQLFKRLNEKQATEREAYLWSVSDM